MYNTPKMWIYFFATLCIYSQCLLLTRQSADYTVQYKYRDTVQFSSHQTREFFSPHVARVLYVVICLLLNSGFGLATLT